MGAAPKTVEPVEKQMPRRQFLSWLSGVGIVGSALAGVFSTFVFMKPRALPHRTPRGVSLWLADCSGHQAGVHCAGRGQAGRHLHHLHASWLHRGTFRYRFCVPVPRFTI